MAAWYHKLCHLLSMADQWGWHYL